MAILLPKSYVAAKALLTCLCAALAANEIADATLTMPGRCCLRPGVDIMEEVTDSGVDMCCVGEAYVKIIDTYPSSKFPEPDEFVSKACQAKRRTVALELGVMRCVPVSPTCDEADEAVRKMAADGEAAFAAACCFGDEIQQPAVLGRGSAYFFGGWSVAGPDGGCLLGTMPVFVSIHGPNCGC